MVGTGVRAPLDRRDPLECKAQLAEMAEMASKGHKDSLDQVRGRRGNEGCQGRGGSGAARGEGACWTQEWGCGLHQVGEQLLSKCHWHTASLLGKSCRNLVQSPRGRS